MTHHAQANLIALIESAEDLIWSVDFEYRLLSFNQSFRRYFELNYGAKASVEMRPQDLLPPERAALWPPLYERALKEGPFRGEYSLADDRILELSLNPIIVDGKATGVSVFGKDISERKRSEQALRNSEEMFRQFAENISAVIYMVPVTANETHYVSPAYEKIWGRSCDSLYQNPMSWMEAIHPDDQAQTQTRFNRQMQGESTVAEYRIQTPNNQEKWIQDRTFPICDQNGQLIRFGGISTDISERKRHESEMALTVSELKTSEERYRAIFEQASVGILQTSFEGHILRCNRRFAEIIGYPIEEVSGLTVQQITAPDDLVSTTAVLQQLASGNTPSAKREKRYLRKDGTYTWVRIAASAQRDGEGCALHTIAFVEDINAYKEAEERLATATKVLRASEERYRKLMEYSPNAVLVVRNHVIDTANRAAVEMFGVSSAGDLIGRRLADVVGPKARSQAEELTRFLSEHEVQLPLEEMQSAATMACNLRWTLLRPPSRRMA